MLPRVLSTIALSLLVLAAAAPAALPQSQPALSIVENNEGALVLSVKIPTVDGKLPGDGSYQFPTAGGLLLVDLQPIKLPGPGGEVDVDAYLAEASFLADGILTELPSMLILPEEETITGPLQESLLELEASITDLSLELERLYLAVEGQAGTQAGWAEDQILTARAEVAWIEAMASEAATTTGENVAEQMLIVNSLLAYVEAMLPLLGSLIEGISDTLAANNPGVPAEVWEATDTVNASLEQAIEDAETARGDLIEEAGAQVVFVEETVGGQAAINGVLVALQAASDGLTAEEEEEEPEPEPEPEPTGFPYGFLKESQRRANENATGAQAKVTELNALVEAELANGQSRATEKSEYVQATAEQTLVAINEALAPLEWAMLWIKEAQETAPSASDFALATAEAELTFAIDSVMEVRDIVEKYTEQEFGAMIDAQLEAASAQLQAASQGVNETRDAMLAAHAELEEEIMGGLEPPEEDPAPEPEEPKDEDLAICFDQPTSVVCAEYQKPGSPEGQLILVITIPNVAGLIPGLPLPSGVAVPTGSLPAGPGVPGGVGAPVPPVPPAPQPTITQSAPAPGTQIPPLPDPTLPSGSSASTSSSHGASSSSSSAASSSESGTTQPAPKVSISAAPPMSALREGQQELLRVAIKNEGNTADDIYLGAQTDAPISIDSTQEMLHLEPGKSGEFVLRLTPLAPGAGTINLIASSGNGATATHDVPVTVADAPSSPSNIAFAVDPMLLDTEVGKLSVLTLRLENKGSVAEEITILTSSNSAQVEPAVFELVLEPGASTIREVSIMPTLSGKSSVQVHMQSERGANLKPIVVMDAEPKSQSVDEDPVPIPSKGKSPGLAVPMIVAVLALALVFVRRRVK